MLEFIQYNKNPSGLNKLRIKHAVRLKPCSYQKPFFFNSVQGRVVNFSGSTMSFLFSLLMAYGFPISPCVRE